MEPDEEVSLCDPQCIILSFIYCFMLLNCVVESRLMYVFVVVLRILNGLQL